MSWRDWSSVYFASDGASYSLLFVMGLYLLAASIVLAVARPSIIPLRAA